jgi:hypothetical protein
MSAAAEIRFVAGTISPMGEDRRPMPSPEPLLPADIRRIASSLEIADYTPQGVDEAIIRQADIEVLAITSRGQWAKQASTMSIEAGVKLVFELSREALKQAPNAEALLVGGGAWRSLAAIPILEEDYSIPIFTNPMTQAWRLIAAGVAPPVKGWGRLLAGA